MPGELCSDELEGNVQSRHRKETFIFAIDTAVSSIRRRVTSHREILAGFALLDPERFTEISLHANLNLTKQGKRTTSSGT